MGDTYVQAYFHIVFAVRNRKRLIENSWRSDLEKYITAIIQNRKHKLIAIGAQPDHIHIFIGYNLNDKIPDLVEKIKTSSDHWINSNRKSRFKFHWQNGYGAFSKSQSHMATIANYVMTQDEHHHTNSFKQEYHKLLDEHDIMFKEKYLFDFFDDIGNKEEDATP